MTVSELLDMIPVDFGGGSGLSKGELMYYLIKKFHITKSIDIGVYRGRSLVPQALAHREHTGGTVYGVDPYDNALVMEKDNAKLRDQIKKFLKENDFGKIYKSVKLFLKKNGLDGNTQLVRRPSYDAISYFKENNISPRLIHIDGNHDTDIVINDVNSYLEILGKDGFIVIDDVSWASVKLAADILQMNHDLSLVFCIVNSSNDYAVFTNIKSQKKNRKLASELLAFGQL